MAARLNVLLGAVHTMRLSPELAGHREGRVGVAWHNNVPMNFVADDFYAVPEADFAHPMQFLRAPDAPYRVVWAAENQQFAVAFRGNLFQKFKIDGIGAVLIHQRTGLHMAAVGFNGAVEGVIDRRHDNDAVSCFSKRGHQHKQGRGPRRGNGR